MLQLHSAQQKHKYSVEVVGLGYNLFIACFLYTKGVSYEMNWTMPTQFIQIFPYAQEISSTSGRKNSFSFFKYIKLIHNWISTQGDIKFEAFWQILFVRRE